MNVLVALLVNIVWVEKVMFLVIVRKEVIVQLEQGLKLVFSVVQDIFVPVIMDVRTRFLV